MGERGNEGVWDQHEHSAIIKFGNQQDPTV